MAINVKFLKGSAESYKNATKDANTFYYVADKDLYLGTHKLTNQAEISAAVADIAANADEIEAIKTKLGEFTNDKFTALVTRVSTAEGAISDLETAVEALEGASENHEGRLATAEGLVAGHTTSIGTLTTDVATLQEESATKTALNQVKELAEANEDAIEVLNGTGDGSVHKQVAEAIAEVVANAPEDFDTLKEVADWIANDKDSAAAMQANVSKLLTDVADHETRLTTAEGEIDVLQDEMDAVEELAAKNKAAHEKNAGDIAANLEKIGKNAEDIAKNTKAISDEAARAKGEENSIKSRLDAVEEMTGVAGAGGNIATQIATAKQEAIAAAKTETEKQVGDLETELRSAISTAENNAISSAASDAASKYLPLSFKSTVESALQPDDIATGSNNGTFAVNGVEVAIAGLKSAAFTESGAYDPAGSAANAQTAAEGYAKSYADGLAKNYDAAGSAKDVEDSLTLYIDNALSWGTI